MPSYKTHLCVGLTLGVLAASYIHQSMPLSLYDSSISLVSVYIGSVLPDIDTPKSYIGRRLPFISYPIYKIFGHRGIFHSFSLYTLLLFISPSICTGKTYGLCVIFMYIGAISHIAIDKAVTSIMHRIIKRKPHRSR